MFLIIASFPTFLTEMEGTERELAMLINEQTSGNEKIINAKNEARQLTNPQRRKKKKKKRTGKNK
jgi:hypothetical protein